MRVSEDEILDMAEDFLGPNYRETHPWIFVSEDGMRRVRMTERDINTVDPHINFEFGMTKTDHKGREVFKVKEVNEKEENYHIFLK